MNRQDDRRDATGPGSAGLSAARAELLDRWRTGMLAPSTSSDPITPGPETELAPTSFAQERHLALRRQLGPRDFQIIAFGAFVRGRVDAEVLAQSLADMAERHETLRTAFRQDEAGSFWQHIGSEPLVHLETESLTRVPDVDREDEAVRRATAFVYQPFDLEVDGAARVALFDLGERGCFLAIGADQVIADGWSLAIAMHEAAELYSARTEARPPRLPSLPIQYRDYASWQRRWMESPERCAHVDYWDKQLVNLSCSPLPHDRSVAMSDQTFKAGTLPVAFGDDLTAALHECATRENVSHFTILLASLNVLLHERTGDEVVAIGMPVANRSRPETHRLIGFFSHFLTVQTPVADDPSFRELLVRTRETIAGALAHQELTLNMYFRELWARRQSMTPRRDIGGSNVRHPPTAYSAMLVFQPPMPTFQLGGFPLEPVELHRSEMLGDFQIILWNDSAGVRGRVEYGVDFLEAKSAHAMSQRWQEIIARGCVDADLRLSQL